LRIATRGSALARWQAEHVASLLGDDVDLVLIETAGDKRRDVPIHEIGGRGVFVKAVQEAVLDGRADIAVHSAKDLESSATSGLVIGAVPERGDPRDALVGSTLADLPSGARIGTGAVRRRAQLAALRPDLTFEDLRGNVDTRLAKASDFDAIVVAVAALDRLGQRARATEVLDVTVMVPQVAQGALAVECRAGDDAVLARLAAIEQRDRRVAVDAERAFLAELGGGCDLPVGAHATIATGVIHLRAFLSTLDGRQVLTHEVTGDDAVTLGRAAARFLLDDAGGAELLPT
jgi:hydroxymethylbilane synthase